MIKKNLSLLFKFIIVLTSAYGVYLSSGLPERFAKEMFLYYTILSNFLCLVYFVFAIHQTIKGKPLNMTVKGAITMSITVTTLIYWFILVPVGFVMKDGDDVSNLLLHLITPLLVIFDYLLFDIKGQMKKKDPIIWLSIPLSYYLFTLIAYVFNVTYIKGARFPYFFIDHTLIGVPSVLMYVSILIMFFTLLGYLIYLLDKMLNKLYTKIGWEI